MALGQRIKEHTREDEKGRKADAWPSGQSEIDRAAQYQRVQIPVRAYRMQKEQSCESARSEVVYVLADGEDGGHQDVAALHEEIGDGQPEHGFAEGTGRFVQIEQIAGKHKEARHVERVDETFGEWVGVSDIH